MTKKMLAIILTLLFITSLLCGCGEKKELTCDSCGTKVTVSAKSNMTDEWAIYCSECEEELMKNNPELSEY